MAWLRKLTPSFVLGHLLLAAIWAGVILSRSPSIAFVYFLASRALYVLYVGFSLRAQDESGWWTRRWGPEGGYHRFKAACILIMNNDAISIGLVCWLTRGTLGDRVPMPWLSALGVAFIVFGVFVKAWAVATIGKGSYYWRSFFIPRSNSKYVVAGPYRWFANPMYTVGYMPVYGIALCFDSLPGLIASFVAQFLVLVLNHWAERPHTEKMREGTPAETPSGTPVGAPDAEGRAPVSAR